MRQREDERPAKLLTCGQVYRKLTSQPDSSYTPYLSVYTNAGMLSVFPNSYHRKTWDEVHPGPPYKEGGPFNSWMWDTSVHQVQSYGIYTSNPSTYTFQYRGGFNSKYQPTAADFGLPNNNVFYHMIGKSNLYESELGTTTWGDVSSHGANAWKKYRPGKAGVEGGVFFGEIRDIPRTLKTTAEWFSTRFKLDRAFRRDVTEFQRDVKRNLKYVGDSWLTILFGWLPFLQDLQDFYKLWKKLDRIVEYIVHNNGRWIKREGVVFEPVSNVDVIRDYQVTGSTIFLNPVLGNTYYPGNAYSGRRVTTRVTGEECWFEARFRYWIPETKLGSVEWRKRTVQKLFGFELSPAMVWNLIPWSWLIDWFTNVGDVLQNISDNAVDNLAAKYAYVMGGKNVMIEDEHTLGLTPSVTHTARFRLARKSRVEANPFGFGLAYSDLSDKQWSILGALGLGRLH